MERTPIENHRSIQFQLHNHHHLMKSAPHQPFFGKFRRMPRSGRETKVSDPIVKLLTNKDSSTNSAHASIIGAILD